MPQVVQDIMSSPPVTISMDTTMEQVRAVFESRGFHHLIVVEEDHRCVGVLSDRDLLHTVSPFVGKMAERPADVNSLKRKAHQVMSRKLISVRPNTQLRAAARIMLDYNISCLPVVNPDRRCVGIVTIRDIVRWAVNRMDADYETPGDAGFHRFAA